MNARNGKKFRYSFEDKDALFLTLRSYIDKFPWESSRESNSTELCWSKYRDRIDESHQFDDALLDFGFSFRCLVDVGGNKSSCIGITVGDYLYFIRSPRSLKRRLDGEAPVILLYRIKWDDVEETDEPYVLKFKKEG